MSKLNLSLIGISLALILGAVVKTSALEKSLSAANLTVSELTQERDDLKRKKQSADAVIAQLQRNAQQQLEQANALQQRLVKLQSISSHQLQSIEELQRENQELRDWASQPLPAAITRLRNRPALTGYDRYCEHLQHSRSVHAQPINCKN